VTANLKAGGCTRSPAKPEEPAEVGREYLAALEKLGLAGTVAALRPLAPLLE
jgi:hypothetical protein